jgi:hypothetical protein
MHHQPWAAASSRRARQFDLGASHGNDPQMRGGGPATEGSARAAGENRRHPLAVYRKQATSNRVDPAMNAAEVAAVDPAPNRATTHPYPKQLTARHNAVLILGQARDSLLPRSIRRFGPHTGLK